MQFPPEVSNKNQLTTKCVSFRLGLMDVNTLPQHNEQCYVDTDLRAQCAFQLLYLRNDHVDPVEQHLKPSW